MSESFLFGILTCEALCFLSLPALIAAQSHLHFVLSSTKRTSGKKEKKKMRDSEKCVCVYCLVMDVGVCELTKHASCFQTSDVQEKSHGSCCSLLQCCISSNLRNSSSCSMMNNVHNERGQRVMQLHSSAMNNENCFHAV